MRGALLGAVLLCLGGLALAAPAGEAHAGEDPKPGLFRSTVALWFQVYQRGISPSDGPRCSLHPTCSRYAVEALEGHGVPLGLWMTTARLMRDHRDPTLEPCEAGGPHRLCAPPEADAWWRSAP